MGATRSSAEHNLPPTPTEKSSSGTNARKQDNQKKQKSSSSSSSMDMKDMPRSMRIILKRQRFLEKRQEQKSVARKAASVAAENGRTSHKTKVTNNKKNNDDKNSYTDLRIKSGENLWEFNRRVEQVLGSSVHDAKQSASRKKEKRKEYLNARKQKAKRKREEDQEEEEIESRIFKKEKIGVNEVVNAPPKITAIPKLRGKAKREAVLAALKKQQASDNGNATGSSSPQNNGIEKKTKDVGRKIKLKNLSLHDRKVLETEREMMIAKYRELKARVAERAVENPSKNIH